MSTINSANNSQITQGATGDSPLSQLPQKELDPAEFMDLMIQELTMQDPMEPMKNEEMVAQFTQIYQMESSKQLTESIDKMVHFSQFSSASMLIGTYVTGLDKNALEVEGIVESVGINDDEVYVNVNGKEVPLKGIKEVVGLTFEENEGE